MKGKYRRLAIFGLFVSAIGLIACVEIATVTQAHTRVWDLAIVNSNAFLGIALVCGWYVADNPIDH